MQQYIEQTYYSTVKIYTDGSKDPESGFTAAVVYIPQFKVKISKRISDHISVFTTEIIAIFLALQWIEEVQPIRSVICTDSLSVLNSLLSGNATATQDMIFEVMQSLFRISQSRLIVNFMWVHHSVEGHEEADRLAKQALKHAQIDIKVSMSKTEVKGLIANEIKKWQKQWDSGRKGRHLHHIQEKVGLERRKYGNRKDDVLMSRIWTLFVKSVPT